MLLVASLPFEPPMEHNHHISTSSEGCPQLKQSDFFASQMQPNEIYMAFSMSDLGGTQSCEISTMMAFIIFMTELCSAFLYVPFTIWFPV